MADSTRIKGYIEKTPKEGNSFAFLRGEDGAKYFLHWKNMDQPSRTKTQRNGLKVGDKFEFVPGPVLTPDKAPAALNVILIAA